jgi:hypothetical protein
MRKILMLLSFVGMPILASAQSVECATVTAESGFNAPTREQNITKAKEELNAKVLKIIEARKRAGQSTVLSAPSVSSYYNQRDVSICVSIN